MSTARALNASTVLTVADLIVKAVASDHSRGESALLTIANTVSKTRSNSSVCARIELM